jgi:hypothetical protein
MPTTKAPQFDTTTIEQNAPGLTFATPQARPADYNSITGALDNAGKAITAGVAFDKNIVLNEASAIANAGAEQYKLGSETNISNLTQEKLRLQSTLGANSNNSDAMKRLAEVEHQLTLAQEQGQIGPGEFKHRMMVAGQELSNQNPAYQAEIAAKMSSVFNATGVTDIIALDSTLLKARQDAIIKRQETKINFVEKYTDTSGLDSDEINSLYKRFVNIEGGEKLSKDFVDHMKTLDETSRWSTLQLLQKNGGLKDYNHYIIGSVSQQVRGIASLPEGQFSIDQKIMMANDVLKNKRDEVLALVAVLPKDSVEAGILNTNIINELASTKEEFTGMANKTNALAYLTNKVSLLVKSNELNLNTVMDVPSFTAKTKLLEVLEKIKPGSVNQIELNNMLTSLGTDLSKASQGIVAGDLLSEQFAGKDLEMLPKTVISIGPAAEKSLKDNGKLDDYYKTFYVSAMSLPNSKLTGDTMLRYQDTYLTPMIKNIPDAVLKELINYAPYNQALSTQLDVYTQTATTSLYQVIGDNKLKVTLNKTQGGVYLDPKDAGTLEPLVIRDINNRLDRVNNIIQIESRISGKTQVEEAEKILTEQFPMLVFK